MKNRKKIESNIDSLSRGILTHRLTTKICPYNQGYRRMGKNGRYWIGIKNDLRWPSSPGVETRYTILKGNK